MPPLAAPPTAPGYRHRLVAVSYDVLNTMLWLPSGSGRLRRRFVDALGIHAGNRVCELGCGTGLVTRHLCAAGADVTAVDGSPAMLAAARRRAPTAAFLRGDVLATPLDGSFERIVLAFILHELDPARRVALLRRAAELLTGKGRIGILEWARPTHTIRGRAWTAAVHAIEPPIAHDILDDGLDAAIAATGLMAFDDRRLAGGRARVVLARA
jgi:ubiquinone/menaquinone biosynthesis C-methylase UbiE